jgi:phosphonoacetaldehyde hydrolase
MEVLSPHAAQFGYEPDSVVCSTDVPAGRPAPWMVYQNMMNTGVYPAAAVVKVGDTIADVLEGLNAGVWTVGVTRTGNEVGLTEEQAAQAAPEELAALMETAEERLRAAGADYVIAGLEEVPGVIEKIEQVLRQS